jgi:hypothetical protein
MPGFSDHGAGIAQLVEQRIRNARVVGSSPIPGTTILKPRGALQPRVRLEMRTVAFAALIASVAATGAANAQQVADSDNELHSAYCMAVLEQQIALNQKALRNWTSRPKSTCIHQHLAWGYYVPKRRNP